MLSLHYHELMGKSEEQEGKKYLINDGYILDKVLDKINKIIDIKNLIILRFQLIQVIKYQTILLIKML